MTYVTPAKLGKFKQLQDALNDEKFMPLNGGTLTGDIIPNEDNAITLGSASKKFKEIYAHELKLSTNSLYIGDTKILGTEANTINIKSDAGQSLALKSQGTGTTNINSFTGINIETIAENGAIPDLSNIRIKAMGEGSTIAMNAPTISLNGATTITNLTVSGNLNVTGTTTSVNSANLDVKDNVITVNKGETGDGVSAGKAGIMVDRGEADNYFIMFDESDDRFKVGTNSNLATIASQSYVDNSIKAINAGGAIQPVYIAEGVAVPTTYTLEKSVPADAKFTDTTYFNGTGISLDGNIINHSNSVTAATAGTDAETSGSTIDIPYVTYDAQGHVTASGTHTHTVTGFNNYVHPSYTAVDSGLYKVTVDDKGHVSAVDAVTKLDITALGIPESDTNIDTKVTSVDNHYTPIENEMSSLGASDGLLTDITNSDTGVQVVTGVKRDAAGHVVGLTSVALKSVNTDTIYTAGAGLDLNGGTFSNSGVHAVTSGAVDGTISVNTNGITANVAVKGLGSAAYTDSDAYAAAEHGNHVPEIEEADDAKFLRNDNTWAIVTPENIGAAANGHDHDATYAKLSGATFTGDITVTKIITSTGLEIY